MKIQILFYFVILCLISGCDNAEADKVISPNNSTSPDWNKEKLPALLLTIGQDVIKTYKGTYSWNYIDESTGEWVFVQADHVGPSQMVNIEEGIKVNLTDPVNLQFSIEPTNYEIRLLDNAEKVIATYKSFKEINELGKYIIEIVGTWGESMATYVVALELTK